MPVIWIILIVAEFVIVTPVIVGRFLPERYVGRARARFSCPPEQILHALLDYDRHPMTGRMKESASLLPADQPVGTLPTWIEDMGRGELITVKTVAAEPMRHMVRDMQSVGVPMTSQWTHQIEPAEGGCWLTLDGETFIRPGSWMVPIFRFMMTVGGGVLKGFIIQMNMVVRSLGITQQYD